MKYIWIILASLFLLTTLPAYGVEVEIKGKYTASGNYLQNLDFYDNDSDKIDQMYYEHDLDLTTKLKIDDETTFTLGLVIRDEVWKGGTPSKDIEDTNGNADLDTDTNTKESAGLPGPPTINTQEAIETDGADGTNNNPDLVTEIDDNILIDRAWLTHKLPFKTKIDVGLMPGGTWGGIAFGDNEDSFYRVRITNSFFDTLTVLGYVEKIADRGYELKSHNAEKTDIDKYALGLIYRPKQYLIAPYASYTYDGSNRKYQGEEGSKTFTFDLALAADLVPYGAEFEYIYMLTRYDNNHMNQFNRWGVYLNVFGKVFDSLKVGAWAAYGSVDETNNSEWAFNFGDDFDTGILLGDEVQPGDWDSQGDDLGGVFAVSVYTDITYFEKMTISPSVIYADSNFKGNAQDGVAIGNGYAIEFDLIGKYALSQYLTYSIGFGYLDYHDTRLYGEDPAVKVYNELVLSF